MIKRIMFIMLLVCYLPFEISAKNGSIEVGGSFSYSISGTRDRNMMIAPELDFYLNKHYYIGPIYELLLSKSYSGTELGMVSGIQNGFVIPLNDIISISTGFGAAYYLLKDFYGTAGYYGGFYYTPSKQHAYTIPAYLGLKMKIAESAYIHLQPTYQYTQIIGTYKDYIHTFHIGIGFSIAVWKKK